MGTQCLTYKSNFAHWALQQHEALNAGMSSEPAEHSEESGKASPSTADKTSVSASATGHRDTQTDGAEEEHTPSQPGKTDQQPAVSASDQPQATDSIQPGVDDWGDFVS